MDTINKIAGRNFNYNTLGSCNCEGHAGPTRVRIAEMIARLDGDDVNHADERTRTGAKKASKYKRALTRRAKRKDAEFAMKDQAE